VADEDRVAGGADQVVLSVLRRATSRPPSPALQQTNGSLVLPGSRAVAERSTMPGTCGVFCSASGGRAASTVQARLLASGLALGTAAIFVHVHPPGSTAPRVAFVAGALFVVECIRASIPDGGRRAELAAADRSLRSDS